MGIASSLAGRGAAAQASELFASPAERAAFERIVGEAPAAREDPAYDAVLSARPLSHLTQHQVELLSREYAATLARNSLRSGNFRVLLRIAIHALPAACRVDALPADDTAPLDLEAETKSADARVAEALNALFLVRSFAMRFVEKQDECPLLAHFNQLPPMADYNAIRMDLGRSGPVHAAATVSDDLASTFLSALVSVLVKFVPTARTYELHVEVLNTLIVLLASVAFPRDRSAPPADGGTTPAQNPFLHLLMTSSETDAAWIVRRLLQNYMDSEPAPATAKASGSYQVALQNADRASLVRISETSETETEESDAFSFLTLEGVGALASSIFRFPVSFYKLLVAPGDSAYPLRDRSALVLLILLQSYRDSDRPTSNPFRRALAAMTDAGAASSAADGASVDPGALSPTSVPFAALLSAVGRNAPFETSHLLFYSLLYTNASLLRWAVESRDAGAVLMPLLETLYHARSVEPSRLYMLVVVLLTYTQDAAFVAAAHTKLLVRDVPWYAERHMLDVSVGSLMVVLLARLVLRNISSLQDSFIHLNAFAALSNLARAAENLHAYAAQSVVGLVALLGKKEAALSARMAASLPDERDALAQKRAAYVEFIRLLLGVVAACLKPRLLPRNPQLIYSLVYHAEALARLEALPEVAAFVRTGPVWRAVARFRGVVEAKAAAADRDGRAMDADAVLAAIRAECVSLLAASAASSAAGMAAMPSAEDRDGAEACYRYEEESDPEQFFVPHVWRIVFEQTPELSWRADKITLFATE